MTGPPNPDRPEEREPIDPTSARINWINRRRERIVAEIQANRRGEYRVPTWVLTVTLVAVVAGFALFLMLI